MKFFEKIMMGLLAAPFVWTVASYVNVIVHNCTDYQYAWWNLFTIIF